MTALQADVADWPRPSLALIDGTVIGDAPFTFFCPKGSGMTMRRTPEGPKVTDLGEAIGGVMQDRFDALLYLGPKASITYAQLPRELCADPDYVDMRANRLATMQGPPGAVRAAAADAFRVRCKALVEGK